MFKKKATRSTATFSIRWIVWTMLIGCSFALPNWLQTLKSIVTRAVRRPPVIDGYVVEISNNDRSLVTEYEPSRGNLACNNAISLSNIPENLELGQRVRVWARGILYSYPAKASGERWEVIAPKMKAKGSNSMTETDAIREALHERGACEIDGIPFVTSVQYNTDQQEWRIFFSGGPDCKPDDDPVLIRSEGK